jgi:hypothetical protein
MLLTTAEFEPAIQRIVDDKAVPQHGLVIIGMEV